MSNSKENNFQIPEQETSNSLDIYINDWIEQDSDFSIEIFEEDLTNPKDSFDFSLDDLIIADFVNNNLDDLCFINSPEL